MSYGRKQIFTDVPFITADNVIEEVRKAHLLHMENRRDIQKLYDYYRGKTAILGKVKEVRENINHKVNENRAYEIVTFHKGYVFGEPIQYIRREDSKYSNKSDDEIATGINALNGYMSAAHKAARDNKLAEWMYVCGTGYRLTMPNPKWEKGGDEPPFTINILDPRNTFVVYHNGYEHRPVMAVTYVTQESGRIVFSVYTEDEYFEIANDSSGVYRKAHALGMMPIVEYPANEPRLGVFEVVMSQLDALDELQSNRMDDVVQYVNSFLAVLGADLNEETYKKLNDWKTLCLPEGTDAKYLSPAMNQNDIQTFKNDINQAIFTICGVPNRNGGSSTSDTGSAVIMRDGWEAAEARAKSTEAMFDEPEGEFLKLVLRILRDTEGTDLRLGDIKPHFTRRNYENIATKAQVLDLMLKNPKIHPELAFIHCGMFPDPESAYLQSKEWWENNREIQNNNPKTPVPGADEAGAVGEGG